MNLESHNMDLESKFMDLEWWYMYLEFKFGSPLTEYGYRLKVYGSQNMINKINKERRRSMNATPIWPSNKNQWQGAQADHTTQNSWPSISQTRLTQNTALVEEFLKYRQIYLHCIFVLKLRLGQILTGQDFCLVERNDLSRQLKSNIFSSQLVCDIKVRFIWISGHSIWISSHSIRMSIHSIWISRQSIKISSHSICISRRRIWISVHSILISSHRLWSIVHVLHIKLW
jgi:hypothetical protein